MSKHIHPPDTLEVQNGESCWLDGNRICGGDCMAFNPGGEGPEKCSVLVMGGQLAQAATDLVKLRVEARRTASTPNVNPAPPKVQF